MRKNSSARAICTWILLRCRVAQAPRAEISIASARSAYNQRHVARANNHFQCALKPHLTTTTMSRILIITSAAHVVAAWYTGGGYASSAVDVYVSGGSTEMFGSVSSGGGYSSPAPPVTKTCANRNAACEWVPSWDTDGLYCSLGSGNYCVDLCDSSLDASACDEADGCVHDGSSCRVADTCASGVKIEGTDIDVSQVFAEFPDNFFDGSYIRTGYSLNGEPVFASTESSPALLLYYGTCSELSDEDGAWLLHLTFADPTNAAAVAEDTRTARTWSSSGRAAACRVRRARTTPRRQRSRRSPINGRRCPCRASTRKSLAAPTR